MRLVFADAAWEDYCHWQTHDAALFARINDLIESRGFKGRFAAFTMAIFDSALAIAFLASFSHSCFQW